MAAGADPMFPTNLSRAPEGPMAPPEANSPPKASRVGPGTSFGAATRVAPSATLGDGCTIGDHVFIGDAVTIGHRVVVQSGAHLADGVVLEDDVFVGSNVSFMAPAAPRMDGVPAPRTLVRARAVVCANAAVHGGVTIGSGAQVGACSVVNRDVPPFAEVVGNPAKVLRYLQTDAFAAASAPATPAGSPAGTIPLEVKGVRLERRPVISDMRGDLSAREVGAGLPFVPKRYFIVHNVPSREVRGEHAHRTLEQLLICIRGAVSAVVDDGERRQEVLLDSPELALYIPPMVWGIQYNYSKGAALLVLASDVYQASDYIRSYDEFLSLVRAR